MRLSFNLKESKVAQTLVSAVPRLIGTRCLPCDKCVEMSPAAGTSVCATTSGYDSSRCVPRYRLARTDSATAEANTSSMTYHQRGLRRLLRRRRAGRRRFL